MKKIVRRAFIAVFSVLITGCTSTPASVQDNHCLDAIAKQLEVTITEGVLSLNGTKVRFPATPQEFVELLGKPTRESTLANTILTWDDLGIIVYVDPNTQEIKEIGFSLQQESFDFSPKKVFADKIIVDGVEITKASTVDQINAVTKGKQFRPVIDGLSFWWSVEYSAGKVYIVLSEKGVVNLAYSALWRSAR